MRIIAVEDEYLGLDSLIRTIKKLCPTDTEVEGFELPSEALRYAHGHPVDVVFIDMETDEIHGLIVAMKLKEINPKTNLIFMSVTNEYCPEACKVYASDYLLKPLRPQRVEQALMNLRYAAVDSG